jgi:pilus assembly protein CpaB
MQRHRILVFFAIAWISALALSWWVYKRATAPSQRQGVHVVAATRDLPVGKRLVADDLKLVEIDRRDAPQGVFGKPSDAIDRAVTTPILANEIVLNRKLAPKGGGDSLTALIEPGMRAVAVQINEMSGVAGFVQPGTRVDVLFVRMLSNGDAAATTILQNVKVIAYGKQLEPGGKLDPRIASTGQTVATLLVTQEEAEKLALAMQRGKIQLALRNPLDAELSDQGEPTRAADLGIPEPVRTPPARPVTIVQPPKNEFVGGRSPSGIPMTQGPRVANDGRITVRVFRAGKVTEDIF